MKSQKQLLPETSQDQSLSIQHQHFANDFLISQAPQWAANYIHHTNPYPLIIDTEEYNRQLFLQKLLYKVLNQIVTNYHRDPKLQAALPLESRMLELLEPLWDLPFQIGHYQPDFVLDRNHEMWVCEINAQFPLNDYIAAYLGSKMIETIGSTKCGLPATEFIGIETTREILKTLTQRFNLNKPIGLLKDHKHGDCINLLTDMPGFGTCRIITPDDLKLTEDGQHLQDAHGVLDQFVCELDQAKILSLNKDVAKVLFNPTKNVVLNDLRTILLIHDKRILSVITNKELMVDKYLTLQECEALQSNVIPTHVVGQLNESLQSSLNKEQWLIKPPQFDKGQGIVLGKNLTNEEWKLHLKENPNHVIQLYVEQPHFQIRTIQSDCKNAEPQVNNDMHIVVGTLLCSDNDFLGPFYRSSPSSDFLQTSGERTFLFSVLDQSAPLINFDPMLIPDILAPSGPTRYMRFLPPHISAFPLNKDACFFVNSQDDLSLIHKYQESLDKNGIALIHVRCGDPDSKFLTAVAESLGKPHSKTKIPCKIWNLVFDKTNQIDICFNTFSMEDFGYHTDCAWELPPPRYFALYFAKADRFGGGFTELFDCWQILQNLTIEEQHVLQTCHYDFEVPNAWEGTYPSGPIMTKDNLFRFRGDIIRVAEKGENFEKASAALNRLKTLVGVEAQNPKLYLPDNTLILVDNSRFLHGRNRIIDPNRHLQRIWYDPNDPKLVPNFNVKE